MKDKISLKILFIFTILSQLFCHKKQTQLAEIIKVCFSKDFKSFLFGLEQFADLAIIQIKE